MATIGAHSFCGASARAITFEPALRLTPKPHTCGVDRYFAFARVDDRAEIAKCYRLRYEVFCLERRLLPPEGYPDYLESDAYDSHSLHFLASDLHGEPAGTARLVLNGPLGLPLVHHCAFEARYRFLASPDHPLSARYAEISRLVLSRGFRRRRDDTIYGGPPRTSPADGYARSFSTTPPPADIPEPISGIFRLIYQESKRRGITHFVAAMERSLQVRLKRMGFPFTSIGSEVDYYGSVRPYVLEVATLDRNLAALKPATLDYMVSGLEPHLKPVIRSNEAGAKSAQADAAGWRAAKIA